MSAGVQDEPSDRDVTDALVGRGSTDRIRDESQLVSRDEVGRGPAVESLTGDRPFGTYNGG